MIHWSYVISGGGYLEVGHRGCIVHMMGLSSCVGHTVSDWVSGAGSKV
jgi:chemotaxis receptor (MCP) glutamine deamidase CheD